MASSSESCHQDTDTEDVFLMPHNQDEAKDQNANNLFYARRKRWNPFAKSSLITLACIALISMLLSGLALHFLHLINPQQYPGISSPLPGTPFGSCGDTPISARDNNCTFDIMSFSWLPTPCADPELTEEFLKVRNWTWWEDSDKSRSVPFEEVAKGDHKQLLVTREYHMYHCTYMWRKLHRGLLKSRENAEGRGVVDTYIGEYVHTAHCEMILLGMEGEESGVNKTATDTAIFMKFPQCMWT
jgi:hypothetical protein